ncbi:HIRAN domain-containing protein [Methylophilaceae bacterium]|nr:HIRAN domain-containing protein [Methylophilaceae bacterium]
MAKWINRGINWKIPDGYKTFTSDTVVGTSFFLSNARSWGKAKELSLELEREPNNKHDKNAIKVIGVSKGFFFGYNRRPIGYIAKQTAKALVRREFLDKVKPHLSEIGFPPNRKYVRIRYSLLVLEEDIKEANKIYRSYRLDEDNY